MTPIAWELAPTILACAVMLIAAAMQATIGRVPNLLTYIALGVGLLFAGIGPQGETQLYALASSIACTVAALGIMLVPYSRGVLGAGCVKAQMAFAAWLGAAAPIVVAMGVVVVSSVVGLIITLVIVWRLAAVLTEDEVATYQFPAQITLSATAIVVTLACVIVTGGMP
jgi:hypothetical protein